MKRKLILPLLLVLIFTCTCLVGCVNTSDGSLYSYCVDYVKDALYGMFGKCNHTYNNAGVCIACGESCNHSYQYGVCVNCGLECKHDRFDQDVCVDCQHRCEHSYFEGVCVYCNSNCPNHLFQNGQCATCGQVCAHHFVSGVCNVCNKVCTHRYAIVDDGGVCLDCNELCKNHSVIGGLCAGCGQRCYHKYSMGYCQKCNTPCICIFSEGTCIQCGLEDPDFVPTIEQIIRLANTNRTYTFEGVIFALGTNGFYVNDGTGSIFVSTTVSMNVGDKVKATGKLTLHGDYVRKPSFVADSVIFTDVAQQTLAPTTMAIKDLYSLTVASKNFYTYVILTGYVTQESNGYALERVPGSTEKIAFSAESNQYLAEYVGKQVKVCAILTDYSSGWKVTLTAENDIWLYTPSVYDVSDAITNELYDYFYNRTVYFYLELPTVYEEAQNITLTWGMSESEDAEIVDNVFYIKRRFTDRVCIYVDISDGINTVCHWIWVHIACASLETFDVVKKYSGDYIIEGKVLTTTFNQTENVYSVVLVDKDNNLMPVSVQNAYGYKTIKKGDEITVYGKYRFDEDGIGYFRAKAFMTLNAAPSDYQTDLSGFNVVTLQTLDDYNDFLVNWDQKTNDGIIVKIVNPYLIYSGNTSYNYIRFGADSTAGSGYQTKENGVTYSRIFAFQINAFDAECSGLRNQLQIPLLNSGAAVQREIVIYAIPMYGGATTLQFSVIDAALVQWQTAPTVTATSQVALLPSQTIFGKRYM